MRGEPEREPSVGVSHSRSRRYRKNKKGRVLQSTAAVFCGRQALAASGQSALTLHWRLDLLAAIVTKWAILVTALTITTVDGPGLPGAVLRQRRGESDHGPECSLQVESGVVRFAKDGAQLGLDLPL